jgi:hypothetical protein
MSFWELDDNEEVTGEFNAGGGNFEPIPDNTDVLAAPDEVKWDSYEGDQYISIRWTILKPEDYANRKIFQKVRVMDADKAKADKAKRMLAAIDANAGGQLRASGVAPDDEMLVKALLNKQMIIKLMTWEIKGNSGNWVSAVSPKSKGLEEPQAPAVDPNEDIGF